MMLFTIASADHYLFNCYADLSFMILVMAPGGADMSVLQNVIIWKKVKNALLWLHEWSAFIPMVVVSYVGSYKQICFSVWSFLISAVLIATFQLQSAKNAYQIR